LGSSKRVPQTTSHDPLHDWLYGKSTGLIWHRCGKRATETIRYGEKGTERSLVCADCDDVLPEHLEFILRATSKMDEFDWDINEMVAISRDGWKKIE